MGFEHGLYYFILLFFYQMRGTEYLKERKAFFLSTILERDGRPWWVPERGGKTAKPYMECVR